MHENIEKINDAKAAKQKAVISGKNKQSNQIAVRDEQQDKTIESIPEEDLV